MTGFRLVDHVGEIVILKVHGVDQFRTKLYGVKPALVVDATLLTEDGQPGERFEQALIFNQTPIDQLEEFAGETTGARIEAYETPSGQAVRLGELTDDELEIVETAIATMEGIRA